MTAVGTVAIAFDHDVPGPAREVVSRLAGAPELEELFAAGGEVRLFPGGASNLNLDLRLAGGRYVLRVAEPSVERFGIDRARAGAANIVAARAGVAPPLAALQLPEGHSLSRFVEGLPLDASSVRESDRLERVGRVLRLMHDCGSIEGGWSVFDDVRRNVATARAESLDLPTDLESLLARMERIEAMFATLGLHERLCHNDLQLQNVIDAGARLWVVDWEYAAMGNPYFDLGGFGVNAELGEDEEVTVLAAYFGELRAADQARVRLMQVMSALREATWAVVAAPVLELDWDYAAWAAEYFDRARRQSEGGAFERRLGLATGGPR